MHISCIIFAPLWGLFLSSHILRICQCFFRYNGFELSQLPQLKSVTIKSCSGWVQSCFYTARNAVFRGMNDGRDGL